MCPETKHTTKRSERGTHNSQRQTKVSQHHVVECLAGIDFANTVVTAVDCGPGTQKTEQGIVDKAKGLAGKLGRKLSLHREPNAAGRSRGNAEEVEMQRVIVSYDVSRTVEEKVVSGSNSEGLST